MSRIDRAIMELGAATARAVLDHGRRRGDASAAVLLVTAWHMGLEVGLTAGVEDVALARVIRDELSDSVGHGPAERAEIVQRASRLLAAAAEEVRR